MSTNSFDPLPDHESDMGDVDFQENPNRKRRHEDPDEIERVAKARRISSGLPDDPQSYESETQDDALNRASSTPVELAENEQVDIPQIDDHDDLNQSDTEENEFNSATDEFITNPEQTKASAEC